MEEAGTKRRRVEDEAGGDYYAVEDEKGDVKEKEDAAESVKVAEAERFRYGISVGMSDVGFELEIFNATYSTFAIPPVAIVMVNHVHVKCRIRSLIASL